MSKSFAEAARGRSWSEQGCLERTITLLFVLLGVAVLIGVGAFLLGG